MSGKETDIKTWRGNLSVQHEMEGKESGSFWAAINGKDDYANDEILQKKIPLTRMFQCSIRSAFHAEPVPNFCQEDLLEEHCCLLDTHYEIFLWIGSKSPENERNASTKMAGEYVQGFQTVANRKDIVGVTIENSEKESRRFKSHFPSWKDKTATGFVDPYEKKKQMSVESPKTVTIAADDSSVKSTMKSPANTPLKKEDLIKRKSVPESVLLRQLGQSPDGTPTSSPASTEDKEKAKRERLEQLRKLRLSKSKQNLFNQEGQNSEEN